MTDKISDLRPPFFMIEDSVVNDYGLTPYEGWLYVVMLKHANRKTGELFPSIQTLVKETKMSKAQVLRCTKSLEEKKLVRVTRDEKKNGKDRAVNHYFILTATRYLPDTTPGISQTLPPVSGGNMNKNQFEPEKDSSAVANGKNPRKPNPIFDAVALGSFGLTKLEGDDKTLGARIGKIVSWLNKQPDITPERVAQFYAWYERKYENADAPRDPGKFAEWWTKFTSNNTPINGDDGEPVTAAYTIGSDDDPFKDEIID